jgi:uncharacterized protein HemX
VNLEHELTEALNRKQPPPGMVDRVMARIESQEMPAAASFWRAHRVGLRLAAALVLLMAIGFGVVRRREAQLERQQAEFAARQLMTALQIASETLNDAKRIVRQ